MDGPQHLRATGHPGHGLDEDVQVLLQPLDDLHGLVVVLAQGSQSLAGSGERKRGGNGRAKEDGEGERKDTRLEPVPTRSAAHQTGAHGERKWLLRLRQLLEVVTSVFRDKHVSDRVHMNMNIA